VGFRGREGFRLRQWIARGAVAALLAALAACGESSSRERSSTGLVGEEIAAPFAMPDIALVDAAGEPWNLAAETSGKVALIFFGYQSCPDICPVHLANVAAVLKKLPDEVRREVQMIFVTTDPARDTMPQLQQWVNLFDRDFIALTGTPEQLDAAQRALGLVAAVADTAAMQRGENYVVGHATPVVAFTADGMARAMYPFGTRQRDWANDLPILTNWTSQ
jgi:protein SCO1/2